MLAVAKVAGRLPGQTRGPQRTHEQVVQEFDASQIEAAPLQEPPGEKDANSNGSDCNIRSRDTEEWSVSHRLLLPYLEAALSRANHTLHSR